jgi:hypothetical protein
MAFLSGPRRGVGRVRLHDPPPGYRPPRERGLPAREQQRRMRRDWVIMRVATVVLVLAAVAFIVMIAVLVATR